ncbi:MAG: hypothetical protein U0R64_01435 [Candidatus Nanopelagicales bacterium]
MTPSWVGDSGVLLHIGPPKTGTTALQNALAAARPRLAGAGVLYPGKKVSHWYPSCAVLGRSATAHPADPPVPMESWDRLVRRVSRREGRAIVSSEGFADAEPDQIMRIVTGLGGAEVRVLITVRGLDSILPSTWQQDLKSGAPVPLPGPLARLKSRVVKPFDTWVADILGESGPRSLFWWRNDFAALADRWAAAVGSEKVAVAVVSPADPERILRETEALVGLPAGLLQREGRANRSLSRQEAELVRRWLVRLENEQFLTPRRYHDWVRRGGLSSLVESRRPGPGETRLTVPGSTVPALRERTERIVAGISRYRVLGDLSDLAVAPPTPSGSELAGWSPDDAAVELLMGVLRAADREQPVAESGGELRATLTDRLRRRRR